METAIGVFASHDRVEEALKELRDQRVPEQSIVFLTSSDSDARAVANRFGEFAGGGTEPSTGVLAATVFLPGSGAVFALGFGAAALLGLVGTGTGYVIGSANVHDPISNDRCAENVQFIRDMLRDGHSLIVVRTDSKDVATRACGIFDRIGMAMPANAPVKLQTRTRYSGDIAIIDVIGRLTLNDGSVILRQATRQLIEEGFKKVLINLSQAQYIDSSGLGELVKTLSAIRNSGGHLKLAALNQRANELLRITKLASVFDIEYDESSAIAFFNGQRSARAAA